MRKLHLDTDIGGDIDDLYALAMVLNWPEGELVAVTTVSDDGGRRAGYVRYGLEIAGRRNVPVAAGADISLGCYQHWQPGFHPDESAYWPEPVQPAPGPSAQAIALLERSIREGATIVATGPYTNLALLERFSPGY
jgi:inosine-uridine nucleoside N-ribohydrolase